jgi:hypothetical protein
MTEEVTAAQAEENAYQDALYAYVKDNQPEGLHDFNILNGFRICYDKNNKPYLWVPSLGYWFPDWRVSDLVAKISKAA